MPISNNTAAFPYVTTVGDAPILTTGYGVAFGTALTTLGAGAGLNGGPGVPSGTFRYYSYNYGRIHIVVLDSMTTRSNTSIPWDPTVGTVYPAPQQSMPSLGAAFGAQWAAAGSPNQMTWLAADLAAVMASSSIDWIVVNYHHPGYSKGSHNSDVEVEMIEMRVLYNPILEAGGADICFHGHSHGFERTVPSAGFFGNTSTWSASLATAGYTPSPGNMAPATFSKPAGLTANGGTTYVVVGSGGQWSATTNPATKYNLPNTANSASMQGTTGSVSLDFSGNSMTLTFIAGGAGALAMGQIGDVFVTCKGPCAAIAPPPAPVNGAKNADTIVYVSFGDWGWGSGANNSLLQNTAAATCTSGPTGAAFASAGCIGNQGYYANMNYSIMSQMGTAAALGATCLKYGGCDFAMNTGASRRSPMRPCGLPSLMPLRGLMALVVAARLTLYARD